MPVTSVSCGSSRFIWEVPVEDSNVDHFFKNYLHASPIRLEIKVGDFFFESVSGLNDFLRLAMDHGRLRSGWV
jgi:hypothetical protein